MTAAGSAGRDEPLRLFFGLPLPPAIAAPLAAWGVTTLAGRPTVRALAPDQLHVTLVFLGNRPPKELPSLRGALHDAVHGLERPVLAVERYRETRSVAMLVLSDVGGLGAVLQARLADRVEGAGWRGRERRRWLAHVTVARLRERPHLRPELPTLPAFSPCSAALYRSRLGRGGARYEILETARLGAGTGS